MTDQDFTAQNIQLRAYDASQTPCEECPAPERILWWTLRDIYSRYKAGQISKDAGEALKQKAMQTYQRDRTQYDMLNRIAQHQAETWKRIEQTATVYAKGQNRTKEADALYEAVYGCKLKDKTGGNDG